MTDLREHLLSRLAQPLPGKDAQFKMAPVHRGGTAAPEGTTYRESAVMLLVCGNDPLKATLPLTLRHTYAGAHSAQVSLPGGKIEPQDKNKWSTAARECFEEIGVQGMECLGALSPIYIWASNFLVHPFVGYLPQSEPLMYPNEREVAQIIRMPLSMIVSGPVEQGWIHGDHFRIEAKWWTVDEQKVWGATAMILSEFSEILREVF